MIAVRLVRVLLVITLLLFIAVTPAFALDGWLADHGREHGLSWNLLRLQELDQDALRAHPSGRVAWLVGPSILRDAIDEEALNAQLIERGSELRAFKVGTDRGAPGIAAGLVAELPLREGDVVVSSMSASNFRKDWLAFADMPTRFVTQTSTLGELWDTRELTVGERLEASVNYFPHTYWSFREETQAGATVWLTIPWDGWPVRPEARFHTRFRQWETHPAFTRGKLKKGVVRKRRQTLNTWDKSPSQFNRRGIDRMQRRCEQADVDYILVDFPTTELMARKLTGTGVHEAWAEFKQELGAVTFERPPDEHFYDYMHTNAKGRASHTTAMAELLGER